jgi:hypothetical protein
MLGHAAILVVFLVLALLVGIPRIKRGPGLPGRLAFEKVPDAALTGAQGAHLARLGETVRALQYEPVFNVRVANLSGPNLTRFYTNAADPAILLTSLLRSAPVSGNPGQSVDYVEIITRYADGTSLTTINSPVTSLFDPPPGRVVQRLPGMDVVRLKERHDRAARELVSRGPRWVRGDEILDRWQESHHEWYEHQVARGLLTYNASTDRYAPSPRTALRGIADYLNPVAASAPPLRIAAGALASIVLVTLGTFLAVSPAWPPLRWAAEASHFPERAVAALAMWVLFTLAGVIVGLTFGHRQFIWALLLGMIPVSVLAGSAGRPVLGVLWLAWVAESVARWHNQRRRLV